MTLQNYNIAFSQQKTILLTCKSIEFEMQKQ